MTLIIRTLNSTYAFNLFAGTVLRNDSYFGLIRLGGGGVTIVQPFGYEQPVAKFDLLPAGDLSGNYQPVETSYVQSVKYGYPFD